MSNVEMEECEDFGPTAADEAYLYCYHYDMHVDQVRHDRGSDSNIYPVVVSTRVELDVKKVTADSPTGKEQSVDTSTWGLESILLELSGTDTQCAEEGCPTISSVDGILQMLECPCYAGLWR